MFVLFLFILCVSSREYQVEYAISSQFPKEWKKRGIMKCERKCVFENEKELIFQNGNEEHYYLRVGEQYTSIPVTYLSKKMVDKIELQLDGEIIKGISYTVLKESSHLTTYANIIHSIDFPKVKAETKEPPKPEKGWFARNWLWVIIGLVVLFLFAG